jgi:hypothetical protein
LPAMDPAARCGEWGLEKRKWGFSVGEAVKLRRTYLVRKERWCSHEQNQSRSHPPHPTVLCQGVL